MRARSGHALVPGWYGGGERAVDLCSGTAVWRHAGLPVVPIRWVLVRDPLGRFDPQALLCTDPNQDPHQVLRWFVQRWQVETTFPGDPGASGRRDPAAMVRPGHRAHHPLPARAIFPCDPARRAAQPEGTRGRYERAWYHKRRPTFSDTLAACGDISGRNRVSPCPAIQARRRNSAQRSTKALPMRSATPPDGQSRD